MPFQQKGLGVVENVSSSGVITTRLPRQRQEPGGLSPPHQAHDEARPDGAGQVFFRQVQVVPGVVHGAEQEMG